MNLRTPLSSLLICLLLLGSCKDDCTFGDGVVGNIHFSLIDKDGNDLFFGNNPEYILDSISFPPLNHSTGNRIGYNSRGYFGVNGFSKEPIQKAGVSYEWDIIYEGQSLGQLTIDYDPEKDINPCKDYNSGLIFYFNDQLICDQCVAYTSTPYNITID